MTAFYSMGIMNYCSHDPGCAIVRVEGGSLDLIFAEEGFLSRKKKSYQFPLRSMKYCLDYFGVGLDDLDVLMVDYMDHRRPFRTSNNYRLLVGDFIRSRLNIDPAKIRVARSHHYAHALTAFWPSEFDEAAVMIVDGLGSEQQTHSIFRADAKNGVDLIYEQKGGGIGILYSLVTEALGFEAGEEGKTMGLAPYGAPHGAEDANLPSLAGVLDGFVTDYSEQLTRNPNPRLRVDVETPKNKSEVYEPYYARLAFNLQQETERCLVHLARETLGAAKSRNLCFAGGVALNCVANYHIQNFSELDGFYVQPAAGDTGIPIGLALAGVEEGGLNLADLMTADVRKKLAAPYSPDVAPLTGQYEERLTKAFSVHAIDLLPMSDDEIAEKLAEKNVVALWTDGIELGPRALGHRSFIADAREPGMKDVLNEKIKHREPYRPFAPIVLQEDFSDYFVSDCDRHPYMLQAPKCTLRALTEVPAICHVDDTARVQTVTPESGRIRGILEAYKNKTATSVLVNTSFNDNEEPIVLTKLDAVCAFLRCNADFLVLEDKVLDRKRISDVGALKDDVSRLQEDVRDEYFRTALRDLTRIQPEQSASELGAFLSFNAGLSKTYRQDRLVIRLIDFLTLRDPSRTLYTDDYHRTQLERLFRITGHTISQLIPQFEVVADTWMEGRKLKLGSDFILYNYSAYHLNPFNSERTGAWEGLTSYYEIGDRLLAIDDPDHADDADAVTDCMTAIMSSYEHDLSQTIEALFEGYGISR